MPYKELNSLFLLRTLHKFMLSCFAFSKMDFQYTLSLVLLGVQPDRSTVCSDSFPVSVCVHVLCHSPTLWEILKHATRTRNTMVTAALVVFLPLLILQNLKGLYVVLCCYESAVLQTPACTERMVSYKLVILVASLQLHVTSCY